MEDTASRYGIEVSVNMLFQVLMEDMEQIREISNDTFVHVID
jgi:hypothetical protein